MAWTLAVTQSFHATSGLSAKRPPFHQPDPGALKKALSQIGRTGNLRRAVPFGRQQADGQSPLGAPCRAALVPRPLPSPCPHLPAAAAISARGAPLSPHEAILARPPPALPASPPRGGPYPAVERTGRGPPRGTKRRRRRRAAAGRGGCRCCNRGAGRSGRRDGRGACS